MKRKNQLPSTERKTCELKPLYRFHQLLIQAQGRDFVIIDGFTYFKGWIDEKIINYCMTITKVQFGLKGGLQPCEGFLKKEKGYFLQIINTESSPGEHWILLEGFLEESPPRFKIYNSAFTLPKGLCDLEKITKLFNSITDHAKSSIKKLLGACIKQYDIQIMKCPQQKTGYDCGVHAIANLVTRANNVDLHNIDYLASSEIRQHLEKCVILREMCMFPHIGIPNDSKATILGTIRIDIRN